MIFWFLRKLRGLHGHLKGHVERIGGSTLVSLLAAVLLLSLGRAVTQIHIAAEAGLQPLRFVVLHKCGGLDMG